ncbi:MAG: hypothetical protein HFP77_02415 [Methylococcales symbiont of Iophon sp. n. MRB-2018]|nr:MAG: hypothetical protein HFP77_02415 [Methylococcales symbiont of Iophon sp. n. MRB-2018]KAF3980422.1 MAG: hypothetical protein HFP76_02210 [Methylococcales symbiont of Iophon sp. n. MRB-2018]
MSWKNTQQTSFADALIVQHKSLSELDDVHNIINWKAIEKTCQTFIHPSEVHPATRY